MTIVWTERALAAARREHNHIAADNPAAANRVFRRVLASVERLRRFPESGRPGRVAGTRELVIPGLPYIVVYRVAPAAVEILTVLHAARRWPEAIH